MHSSFSFLVLIESHLNREAQELDLIRMSKDLNFSQKYVEEFVQFLNRSTITATTDTTATSSTTTTSSSTTTTTSSGGGGGGGGDTFRVCLISQRLIVLRSLMSKKKGMFLILNFQSNLRTTVYGNTDLVFFFQDQNSRFSMSKVFKLLSPATSTTTTCLCSG